MTKYKKCGHEIDAIILADNEMSLMVYEDWVDSVGCFGSKEICFDCYVKGLEKSSKGNGATSCGD